MTEPRIVPSSSASTRASSVSYECSVCLENLDAPASIDEPATGGADAGNNENDGQAHEDGTVGRPRGNTARIRVRHRAGRSSHASQRRPIHVVTPTDVVATHCGHMYHQVCLDKWFTEQRKRTCPSCRKAVPRSKLIRLFPNISVDSDARNQNVGSKDVNLPGPSGSSGRQCTNAECQNLKVIHNTLINDFKNFQELKEAQIRRLEDDNTRQCNEIERLKRKIEEVGSAAFSPTANKRRRYQPPVSMFSMCRLT